MKAYCTKPVLITCTILLFLILAQENRAAAVEPCNPMQLMPCEEAIVKGSNPSKLCCDRLKQQQHCVCQYMKNPNFKSFLGSPNAKKIATHCHCPIPKC
ncbi:non-specific lipid-transfer protein 2 [Raphanus sativus]|uniref:Non-specific lipid-transfer protein 2 n=1 Tax=Raphanus sativus TaxID=3726 RepID=A0A6J0KZ65_RAPSA|nr:non-specific lipid-transfer protein 2 [Raphanus sativus]